MKKMFLLLLLASCATSRPTPRKEPSPDEAWKVLQELYPEYTDSDIAAVLDGCTTHRRDSAAHPKSLDFGKQER